MEAVQYIKQDSRPTEFAEGMERDQEMSESSGRGREKIDGQNDEAKGKRRIEEARPDACGPFRPRDGA